MITTADVFATAQAHDGMAKVTVLTVDSPLEEPLYDPVACQLSLDHIEALRWGKVLRIETSDGFVLVRTPLGVWGGGGGSAGAASA